MPSYKKTYSKMLSYDSYEDRLSYLQLHGSVAYQTFGSSRYLNQAFYSSPEWKQFRNSMIIRDSGCDLALLGHQIFGKTILHHINPITEDDLRSGSDVLLDPENIVCVSVSTHNAIHYGSDRDLIPVLMDRNPNDTCLWKGGKL